MKCKHKCRPCEHGNDGGQEAAGCCAALLSEHEKIVERVAELEKRQSACEEGEGDWENILALCAALSGELDSITIRMEEAASQLSA